MPPQLLILRFFDPEPGTTNTYGVNDTSIFLSLKHTAHAQNESHMHTAQKEDFDAFLKYFKIYPLVMN